MVFDSVQLNFWKTGRMRHFLSVAKSDNVTMSECLVNGARLSQQLSRVPSYEVYIIDSLSYNNYNEFVVVTL